MILATPLLIALVAFTGLCLARLRSFLREHRLHKVLFHLGTGHHADGHHRNNRTWRRPATRSRHDWHMGWLARQPRLHRMGMFWGGLLILTYGTWGWFTVHTLTVVLLSLTLIGGIIAVALGVARRVLRRPHRRTMVHPIAAKLASHMRQSPVAVARNLRIRPQLDNLQPGDVAVILSGFPDEYAASPSDRDFVEQVFTSFLPCQLKFDWETSRFPMRMVARCKATAPLEATLAVWAPAMDQLGFGQYFLGAGAGLAEEVWDANSEDPHGLVNALSRAGKTNLNLAIIAQALRRGERVSAVDPKRVSLSCLMGVPGFRLSADPRNVSAMWELIKDFRADMDNVIDGICLFCRRQRTGMWDTPCPGCGRCPVPALLVLEEMNQLFELFRLHWEAIKEPGQRITDVPAWADVKAVLHQGGQFGYRVWIDGQDLKDRIVFSSRSQFGKVVVGKCTEQQWRYVARTTPVPPPPSRRGRFAVVEGGTHRWVQVVCADPRKGHGAGNERGWREFALGGAPAAGEAPDGGWRHWARLPRLALPAPPHRASREEGPKAIPAVLIGPKQAATYLGWTQEQFRMARRRYPIPGEFKHTVRSQETSCWTQETLQLWEASLREHAR